MGQQILVTGAMGFIGRALSLNLLGAGYQVRGTIRDPSRTAGQEGAHLVGVEWATLHDQSTEAELKQVLDGVQVVIHLAARVHVMTGLESDRLHEFYRINTDWTKRLARAAAGQGVRRFVYMSSIKVNGEKSSAPFTEADSPRPQDLYGISKWKAEQALATVSSQTGLEVVVIRSPLVYGPGVGGNFLHLLNIVRKGIPMPFALVKNRRSLIYRGNLVAALIRSVWVDRAAGRTYLVSDGEDLSTPDLIRRLGKALRLPVRLWPLPIAMLRSFGQVVGKQVVVERLLGSLQVNPSKIMQELDWHPPFLVNQGLAETADWFRTRLTS
ncbi:MAG: NAD-dependent epimerase/dehydratase family protein [Nitrospira sp.]|nr:NAD-dependent epimerase/dehydratase family protein [Nitrospira sp.]